MGVLIIYGGGVLIYKVLVGVGVGVGGGVGLRVGVGVGSGVGSVGVGGLVLAFGIEGFFGYFGEGGLGIVWLLDAKFFVEVVLVDVEPHGVETLHDAELLFDVHIFGLLELELAPSGVEAQGGKDVGELIIEDVEDVFNVSSTNSFKTE